MGKAKAHTSAINSQNSRRSSSCYTAITRSERSLYVIETKRTAAGAQGVGCQVTPGRGNR